MYSLSFDTLLSYKIKWVHISGLLFALLCTARWDRNNFFDTDYANLTDGQLCRQGHNSCQPSWPRTTSHSPSARACLPAPGTNAPSKGWEGPGGSNPSAGPLPSPACRSCASQRGITSSRALTSITENPTVWEQTLLMNLELKGLLTLHNLFQLLSFHANY